MTTPTSSTEPISYPVLSGKPGSTVISNPPFHPNILSIGGANAATNPTQNQNRSSNPLQSSQLQRGKFVGGAGVYYGSSTGTTYVVNFLYNPSTITETRSLDINSGVLPSAARVQYDPGNYATDLNATISFSLLFDRTFELWDSGYVGTQVGNLGARVDMEAFYNLLGINQTQTQTSTYTIPGSTATNTLKSNVIVQGPMIVSPCNLYFSSDNTSALSYYGYISSTNTTWSHFTPAMVPVRFAIDITFTIFPTSASNYTTG